MHATAKARSIPTRTKSKWIGFRSTDHSGRVARGRETETTGALHFPIAGPPTFPGRLLCPGARPRLARLLEKNKGAGYLATSAVRSRSHALAGGLGRGSLVVGYTKTISISNV
jgi:hypothetical protein